VYELSAGGVVATPAVATIADSTSIVVNVDVRPRIDYFETKTAAVVVGCEGKR
jgi:hypothetical protein